MLVGSLSPYIFYLSFFCLGNAFETYVPLIYAFFIGSLKAKLFSLSLLEQDQAVLRRPLAAPARPCLHDSGMRKQLGAIAGFGKRTLSLLPFPASLNKAANRLFGAQSDETGNVQFSGQAIPPGAKRPPSFHREAP